MVSEWCVSGFDGLSSDEGCGGCRWLSMLVVIGGGGILGSLAMVMIIGFSPGFV